MKVAPWIFAALVNAILMLACPHAAYSQDRVAGIVQGIQGSVYWKRAERAKEIKLDPNRDLARRLNVGEWIRCDRDGVARLLMCDGTKELNGDSGSFAITRSQVCKNQEALEEYGRLGGRDRGEPSSPVFSPSNRGAVRPDSLIIRWIPSAAPRSFSLTIEDAEHKEIWRQDVASPTSGHLVSETAKQALAEYRSRAGVGPLVLSLKGRNLNESRVVFWLLSPQSEQALDQELAAWDKQTDGIMRHLGRAHAFVSHRMFTEAAEEYEEALKQAPMSRDLLIRTTIAHRLTGNTAREEELNRRLPRGTKLP